MLEGVWHAAGAGLRGHLVPPIMRDLCARAYNLPVLGVQLPPSACGMPGEHVPALQVGR